MVINPKPLKEEAMREALLRNMSFCARRFLQCSAKSNTFFSLPKQPSIISRAALTPSQLRSYSSEFYSTNADVSNKELKMRIQKFYDGDDEAIPSILEAILKRKLSGKHEESDDELMNEIRGGDWKLPPQDDDADDQEFDSGSSDSFDSDTD